MIEKEIRTPQLNILFCKMIITEEGKIIMELKNGKRVEQVPLEAFLTEVNRLISSEILKLHIAIE